MVKSDLSVKIDERLPSKVVSTMNASEKRHAKLEKQLDTLESRVNVLDARMHEMLQHQRVQTDMLQHLLMTSGFSVPRPPSFDENKKGDKDPLPSPAELVARIPPPYFTANELKAWNQMDSIKERLDQLMERKSSSTSQSSATVVPTSYPTTKFHQKGRRVGHLSSMNLKPPFFLPILSTQGLGKNQAQYTSLLSG